MQLAQESIDWRRVPVRKSSWKIRPHKHEYGMSLIQDKKTQKYLGGKGKKVNTFRKPLYKKRGF